MINHARTLLLNADGSAAGYDAHPGDEFIPPAYRTVVLPSFLNTMYTTLFGAGPDRVFLNYRVRQLIGLLHTTELVEFVTDLDPRITYDVLPLDELFNTLFTTTATPLLGTTAQYFPQGRLEDMDSFRVDQQWLVEVTSGSVCRVTRQTSPVGAVDNNYTITNGLSNVITLTGSSLGFMFSPGVGSSWLVRSATRPGRDLGMIMADVDAITEDVTLELFGIGSTTGATEPFKTFRNLFKKHPELPYRLGGILLAMIYRIEQLRQ